MTLRPLLTASVIAVAIATASWADTASGWQLEDVGGVTCRAVYPSGPIDTQLLRNKDGKLVLIAGFPGRFLPIGDTRLSLGIDDEAAVDTTGQAIGGIVLILLSDDAQAARLRSAKTLKWHFPWGDFTAAVDGLGDAFDKIAVCPGE